jgi:hypothetical protein
MGSVAVELTADDLQKIDEAGSKVTVAERYPEALEKLTGI